MSRPTNPTRSRSGGGGRSAGRNRATSTPRGSSSELARQALAAQDLAGLGVAGVGARRPGAGDQRSIHRNGGGYRLSMFWAEHTRNGVRGPRSRAQRQDLGHGQPERLLVQVDEVPAAVAEEAPQRPGVEEEQVGVAAERPHRHGEVVAVRR